MEQLHKITGSILQETLRYHMDDDDRQKFTVASKGGENLPEELRGGLDGRLKTWIQTKYNKLYLSFIISQGVKNPFSETQKSKLWHWWQGSVSINSTSAKPLTEQKIGGRNA